MSGEYRNTDYEPIDPLGARIEQLDAETESLYTRIGNYKSAGLDERTTYFGTTITSVIDAYDAALKAIVDSDDTLEQKLQVAQGLHYQQAEARAEHINDTLKAMAVEPDHAAIKFEIDSESTLYESDLSDKDKAAFIEGFSKCHQGSITYDVGAFIGIVEGKRIAKREKIIKFVTHTTLFAAGIAAASIANYLTPRRNR